MQPDRWSVFRFLVVWLVVATVTACSSPPQTPALAVLPTPIGKLSASQDEKGIDAILSSVSSPDEEMLDSASGATSLVWQTSEGPIAAIMTPAPGTTRGVVFLSGADGGFNGPDSGLYEDLVRRLHQSGVTALQIGYRWPTKLDPSAEDALVGLKYLQDSGITGIAIVGFSFGGAVAIETAAQVPAVRAVLTVSSQNAGTDHVDRIAPRPLAVIHAAHDAVVPAWAAHDIFDRAGRPKELIILPTADHYLTDTDASLAELIHRWLLEHLPAGDTDT